jgi:hypothetical protein
MAFRCNCSVFWRDIGVGLYVTDTPVGDRPQKGKDLRLLCVFRQHSLTMHFEKQRGLIELPAYRAALRALPSRTLQCRS